MNTTSPQRYMYLLYALSFAGFLFSGYLSGTKFFTMNCAFGESCPLFIGYPACYFGFALFTIILVSVFVYVLRKKAGALVVTLVTSILGILFAGKFVLEEIAGYIDSGFQWSTLGFPTCAYGLIFFILILVVGLKIHKNNRSTV